MREQGQRIVALVPVSKRNALESLPLDVIYSLMGLIQPDDHMCDSIDYTYDVDKICKYILN